MQTGSSSPGIDQTVKRSKKRKRSGEGQQRNALKDKTFEDDCQTDSPATKRLKEHVGSQLTRKQKRNRKKNSSKKNKYKHLALNKSGDEGNKASFCSVTDRKDLDTKESAVLTGSKSESRAYQSLKNNWHSTEREGSSQRNPLVTLTERPEFTEQKLTPKKKLVSSAQIPVAHPKRKKKGKMKYPNEKKSQKHDHLNKPETQEIHDCDDDDSAQEMSDCENSDSDHGFTAVDSTRKVCKISHREFSPKKKKSASALDKAHEKLNAARFRYLNEQLYTSTGAEAMRMFQDDPEAFQVYHQGFQHQVSQWPVNPLDVIIRQLDKMSKSTVVADFGCGDARLAESLPHNVVHSFDLVSTKPCVTACDISKVPLENSSVDVAVFCLSLMGTNLSDYLCEANRVLQKGGLLKITEVISRFYSISRFVKNVEGLGFQLQKKTFLNKMFMLFTFKKVRDSSRKHAPRIQLKACFYKRR